MKQLLGLLVGSVVLGGCLEQYNPWPHREKFEQERLNASGPSFKLDEGGKWPDLSAGAPAEVVEMNADVLYGQYCSSCHGADGLANGPVAAAMNPRPRNFHDKTWQASVDDEHIATVISQGGQAVGLSPTMPPWGGQLNADQVKAVVEKIRAFGR